MRSANARSDPPEIEGGRRQALRVRITCLAWFEATGESVQSGDNPPHVAPTDKTSGPPVHGSGIGRTVDLSSKGVGLVLAKSLPNGARIVVEFVLAGGLRLRARGFVAHSTPDEADQFRVGVCFDSPPVLVDPDVIKD